MDGTPKNMTKTSGAMLGCLGFFYTFLKDGLFMAFLLFEISPRTDT